MIFSRKSVQLFAISIFILVFWVSYHSSSRDKRSGYLVTDFSKPRNRDQKQFRPNSLPESVGSLDFSSKTNNSDFTRTVVTACMDKKEVAWMHKELSNTNVSIYVAGDLSASLHPPKNKGHEVIIYLSYIIDNYAQLPDVIIFMHSHRWARHNNQILDYDAAQMIKRLNSSYVIKQGYVNMRCEWDPGCPEWLYPSNSRDNLTKQEEAVLSKSWNEIFPLNPSPPFLAQACCAQFAVSKERILSTPMSRYIFYRDWMLATPLSDYIAGRIWEYSWHFVFTGEHSYCPLQSLCYCEGFGICFGGEGAYHEFQSLQDMRHRFASEMEKPQDNAAGGTGTHPELSIHPDTPSLNAEPNPNSILYDRIRILDHKIMDMKNKALKQD